MTFFTSIALFPTLLILGAALARNLSGSQKTGSQRSLSVYSMLLALLLLVTLCFLVSPLPNYLKDVGIRHRIQTVSDEARLQAWANQILQTPFDKLPVREHYDKYYFLDDHSFPDYVRRVPLQEHYQQSSYRVIDDGKRGRYLEMDVWHGRPQFWGVLFCLPSYDPTGLKNRWIRRWKPGMYGWQELNAPPS